MNETDPRPSENATSSPPSGSRSNDISVTSVSEKLHSRNDAGKGASNPTEHQASPDGDLERAQTAPDGEAAAQVQNLAHVSTIGPVHSVFTKNQKRFIVFMASFGGFFSPISANIYFPALNALALDLGVTSTLINLTLTSYMVCHAVKLFFLALFSLSYADLPRSRAFGHWQPRRQRWPTPGVHNMFCHLHWRQCRPGPTEQLCRPFCASVYTKLWQQWHNSPL